MIYAGAEVQIEYTLIGLFHIQTSDKHKNTRAKSPFESSSIPTDILEMSLSIPILVLATLSQTTGHGKDNLSMTSP